MVIIVSREGWIANRLWHASAFIVNARENQYRVCHLFFEDYYKFFSESLEKKTNLVTFLGKRPTWFGSLFQSMISFSMKVLLKLRITRLPFIEIVHYRGNEQDRQAFDLNNRDFIRKAQKKIVLVYGWLFRDIINERKHRQLLIETWRPNKNYSEKIDEYWCRYKKNCEILVGVHIRRGDYKTFFGGKWFYETQQYYEKMKELADSEVFNNRKIGFVICTDEKDISFTETEKFSVFYDKRHFIEDLYLLSKCDYIIGPPSTFSGVASFFGNVPLYRITDINNKISNEIVKAKPINID